MKSLPDEIRKVIAADESLISPKDAIELIKPPRAAGIFNIKLMKCGGVSQGLKIADIAQHEGIDLFWGCTLHLPASKQSISTWMAAWTWAKTKSLAASF